jgi:hypothetical protein
MIARDSLVLGFEVINRHRGLRGPRAAISRRNSAVRLLLRQRRSQVDLHEGSDIRYEREARRFTIVRALLSPRRNLVCRVADLVALGVAESLTAAAIRVSPDSALVAASTNVTRSLVCLVDESAACGD